MLMKICCRSVEVVCKKHLLILGVPVIILFSFKPLKSAQDFSEEDTHFTL